MRFLVRHVHIKGSVQDSIIADCQGWLEGFGGALEVMVLCRILKTQSLPILSHSVSADLMPC